MKQAKHSLGSTMPLTVVYLANEQFERMDSDWVVVTAMLARMIDRASDFCKYDSDTDYRGVVMEEPNNWEAPLFSDLNEATF